MKQPAGDGVQELFQSDEEVEGPVVQWLARDSRDHVALFTATGAADVSRIVLDELDAHRRALAAILCSPPTTRSVFDPAVGTEWGSRWRDVVERGLFVFVAYRPSGPFWIVEAPRSPLEVIDLPAVAAELVARLPAVPFPFKHLASVMPESLGAGSSKCGPGGRS